jgi:epoxyqueuosine reductase
MAGTTQVQVATLTARVKARAVELGFDQVGIAPVDALSERDRYLEWIAQHYEGTMGYMARRVEERLDPMKYLAGAKTVVVVAKNYYTDPPAGGPPDRGFISRYAWGEDYHHVLGRKLEELAQELRDQGAKAKVCVDTAPVLEKAWAQAAGIGWQGKHSNVISKEFSSWIFLGEILTDAELAYDAPFAKGHCGMCTRCIDVCPTGAIVAPYVVDARLCISYLTIEHRGVIPRELRPKMGNLIFGCDLCQDVCPWNRFAKKVEEPGFWPREGNYLPALAELAGLSNEEFRRRFRGSPVLRAKRSGFVRNVVIALGNSRSPEAVEPLGRALRDSDAVVRLHAAWALGQIGTPKANELLSGRLSEESDEAVRAEIRQTFTASEFLSPDSLRPTR